MMSRINWVDDALVTASTEVQSKLVDRALARFKAQEILFSAEPSRLDIQNLALPFGVFEHHRVNVWRNQNFETFEGLLSPFLNYASLKIDFCINGYDDTLDFSQWKPAAIELLWLDSSRYSSRMAFEEWADWLRDRLLDLRSKTTAPILVASWVAWQEDAGSQQLETLAASMPGIYVVDLDAACREDNVILLDPRVAKISGSPISRSAQVTLARRLGCQWIPGLLLPPIKAVAVDLDNTLHAGILGEDGVEGVRLEDGHVAFQKALYALKTKGIFIALVSRNEREDVRSLFARRADYPVRWDDFSVIEVSWGSKADALRRVAQQLRIALNAVLFIDDNPGELVNVTVGCPDAHTLFAAPTGAQAWRALHYYPGLWHWSVSADDAGRVQDMKANAERDKLAREIGDAGQYFRELGITLDVRYNAVADLPRLADLCRKTNQFNLALRRYNDVDLAAFLVRGDACVAAVSLTDRLSDSGTIAVLVAVREHDVLVVEELCISCRALGRQLEDTIVFSAVRGMPLFYGCRQVRFHIVEGPRNQPARDWFNSAENRLGGNFGSSELQADMLANFVPPAGVALTWE
ncbi:HAD-IIIC family phosphatase [Castellaniella hirudinis]|uniref:HAD-IIIC family phosphatase n=1 Tax=Castellaniella hirudinis TaxID=1144617 RepID=UPI0039C35BF6